MRLGDTAQISIGVKSISGTIPFYHSLGFQTIAENSKPYSWIQITDGTIRISLGEDGDLYAGLTFFASDMEARVDAMKKRGAPIQPSHFNIGDHFQAEVFDPDGFGVSFIQYDGERMRPLPNEPLSHCGRFGEISIEVADFEKSLQFWERVGMRLTYRHPTGHWGTLAEDHLMLGIYEKGHCKHLFKNPSLTYFEPDMEERIARLKQKGVRFVQELPNKEGRISDAIAEAPDGQYFFLFSA